MLLFASIATYGQALQHLQLGLVQPSILLICRLLRLEEDVEQSDLDYSTELSCRF